MENLIFSPPVIAHRGASASAPENTISAFTKAIQQGAKWVEFDVQLSQLNEPVVFHDENLFRITNIYGRVIDYPYSFLGSLDAGGWFHPNFSEEKIPLLSQALNFLFDKGISVNIELKPEVHREMELVLSVLTIVNRLKTPNSVVCFSSFCLKTLNFLRQKDPDCHIAVLLRYSLPNWLDLASNLKASAIHISDKSITPEKINEIKTNGYLVNIYTVNDPIRAKTLYQWGVDAIFTDTPDLILRAIDENK